MKIPAAPLQFSGRILATKQSLEKAQAGDENATSVGAPGEEGKPAPQGADLLGLLGPGWQAGDVEKYSGNPRFEQAKTPDGLDLHREQREDLNAADLLIQRGVDFAWAPNQVNTFADANDRRTHNKETVRQRIIKRQPVAYVCDPSQQSPQYLLSGFSTQA